MLDQDVFLPHFIHFIGFVSREYPVLLENIIYPKAEMAVPGTSYRGTQEAGGRCNGKAGRDVEAQIHSLLGSPILRPQYKDTN